MPAQALTDMLVRSLKAPSSGRAEITDSRCRGLALRVTANGEKSWAFRYRDRAGKPQRLTMGRYPDLSLADARARADDERRRVSGGASPAAEKRDERGNTDKLLFDHLADRYLVEHAYRFKKSAKEDERSLKLHLRPKWARMRYAEIRRRDVVELIEGIYASGRHALAVRLKATVSKIFAFAISKDLLDVNPASGIGRIADLKPRERVLADDEIRMGWHLFIVPPASRNVGLALRLVLATGQRPGEVAGMRVAELSDLTDHQTAVWRLPAARSKNGRDHTIPLTPLAILVIQEALSSSSEIQDGKLANREYVFPSPRTDKAITAHSLAVAMTRIAQQTITDAANSNLDRFQTCAQTWLKLRPTPHDLRRTAATRMRALGFSSDDVKHVLNHAPTSVLGRHYDRYDPLPEKRRALGAWATHLARIVLGHTRATVGDGYGEFPPEAILAELAKLLRIG